MSSTFKLACLALAGAIGFASAPVVAEDMDEDEQFTLAVKDFGYAGGAAWLCAEKDNRGAIERQALKAYNGIAQLFGTDEAFFFSAAFGAGTSAPVDKAECTNFLNQFEKGMAKAGEK